MTANPTLTLRIDELKQVLDRLMTAAEDRFGAEIELPWDYYWHLPVESAVDVSREPEVLTMGQLTDDLEELSSLGPATEVLLRHDLGHVIGVLRAIEAMDRPLP
jgi:hypothetical protein